MFYVCQPSPHRHFFITETAVAGARFCTLHIPLRRGRPRWRPLRRRLGGELLQALVPNTLPRPEFIRPYYTAAFERQLLLNAFLHVVSEARQLVLLDPDGRLPEVAGTLLPAAQQLTVITHAPQRYEPFCANWLDSLGTQPVCTPRLAAMDTADAVFSPLNTEYHPAARHKLVFGDDGYHFCREALLLPTVFAKVLPPGISPFAFASALYTECGVQSLQTLLPRELVWGEKRVNIYKLRAQNFYIDIGV